MFLRKQTITIKQIYKMDHLTSDIQHKPLFSQLDPNLSKQLSSTKPQITCSFSLDQMVDFNDIKNNNFQIKNDTTFVLQIRQSYLLEIAQKETEKNSKSKHSEIILSGVEIGPQMVFEIKRQYQQDPEPLPRALGIILYLNDQQAPLELIYEGSDTKVQNFGKILESKFAVQKNFHKIFKPLRKLGKGSSALVVEGKDLRDSQNYAIKGFKKSRGFSLHKGIFLKQLEFMRNNQHPQIVKLNSIFQTQNSLYMVYDKYDQNLYDFIINKGLETQYELKAILKGILEVIEYLHSKGIMHRDIKPENIMIKRQEFEKKELLKRQTNILPVLIDFGFAQNEENQQFTIYRCGTPGFIAPEILKDYMIGEGAVDSFNSEISVSKKRYGKACDIFSLGCLFHILLTNKMVFEGQTRKQLIRNNMEANINPTNKEYKLLDIKAKKLMFRMLQKDPQKRITASEALKDDFFKLQMFNFKPIKFRNPFLPDSTQENRLQEEDDDRHLLLFQ